MLILPDIRPEKEQSWQKILEFEIHGPRKKKIFSTHAIGDRPIVAKRLYGGCTVHYIHGSVIPLSVGFCRTIPRDFLIPRVILNLNHCTFY